MFIPDVHRLCPFSVPSLFWSGEDLLHGHFLAGRVSADTSVLWDIIQIFASFVFRAHTAPSHPQDLLLQREPSVHI